MEENAKEIERELRESIDLLQNQLREVRSLSTCLFIGVVLRCFATSERETNGTIAIHDR